jgi:RHS repeat-associated protein
MSWGRDVPSAQGEQSVPPLGSLVVPGVEALDSQQGMRDAQSARRANPGAVAARVASRRAYRGLSTARAATLAHEAFPQALAVDGPRALAAGQRITRYLDDDAATVELANHEHAVLQSTVPIAAPNAAGEHVPLDLGLHATSGGYAPSAAADAVRIPRRLDDGVTLAGSDLTITPTASDTGSSGRIDGGAVLYANTQIDADTLVKPVAQGVDLDAVLRSPQSPEQVSFRVADATDRAVLSAAAGGRVNVRVGASVVATVLPPSATDAAGTPVPVSMSVAGNLITLTIAHRSHDYQYPIEVDPTFVTDKNLLGVFGSESHWREGSSYQGGFPAMFLQAESTGLLDEPEGGVTYERGAWGAWAYETQGTSEVYEFYAETNSTNAASDIENKMLILGPLKGIEGELVLPSNYGNTWAGVASATGGTSGNAAEFIQVATNPGNSFRTLMSRAEVMIKQYELPTIKADTTDPTRYGTANLSYTGGWMSRSEGVYAVTAHDPGVGVSEVQFRSPQAPGWAASEKYLGDFACEGVQCEPTQIAAVGGNYTEGTAELAEGKSTLEATVYNATGANAAFSMEIKVDREAPHGLTITGLPANGEIGDGVYHLKATASDGSGTTASSGVQPVSVTIDGKTVGTAKGGCSVGPCTTSGEWAISGSEYAVGQHALKFTATDYAGNPATIEQPLFVTRPVTPVNVGPGTVSPESGELNMTVSDVSVGSPGGGLTVERSFGSQHLTAGAEGPLGPAWSLDLGGARNITKLPTGSVLLSDGGNLQSVFTPTGGGQYAPPSGDENLKLVESTVAGKVQFALTDNGGSITTFTLPTGGTGNTWVPTKEAGPNNTNVSTFAYKVVGSIVEPTEELAPVPANVTCTTELVRGCRALKFVYATSTTATGEGQSQWGDYTGRLKQITFTAWNPATSAMASTTIAQYQYDSLGRLRTEWDPRISPAIKSTFGYDSAGRVTSLVPAGEQPWLFNYGTTPGDVRTGRLLSVTRPAPSTAAGTGITPANTALPSVAATKVVEGVKLTVANGSWSNSPLAYSYQWQECLTVSGVESCSAITGATNPGYVPVYHGAKRWLKVAVTAINANGALTATTAATPEILPDSYMVKGSEFGATGTGNGQFSSPQGIATDGSGNVWVADSGNNRVEKFSSTGAFIAAYGTLGSGVNQFHTPTALTISNSGTWLWVADQGNKRVVALNTSTGAWVGSVAVETIPEGVAVTSVASGFYSGDIVLYVSEPTGKISVHVASSPGASWTTLTAFGSPGTGNGQFSGPMGMTWDPTTSRLYVTDRGNHRVQVLKQEPTTLAYVSQFGTLGSGEEQFSAPTAIDYQAGDLFVDDATNNRVQRFIEPSTQVDAYTEPAGTVGVALYPHTAAGSMYILNKTTNKVARWTSATRAVTATPPTPGTSAVWTLEYKVPVFGTTAPNHLGEVETSEWGQADRPVEAMAVLPPDSPQGWPASSYSRATIYYLDPDGHTVNVAKPGGSISTTEYNSQNDVVRSLSADARQTALTGGESVEVSKLLDTQSTYSEDGSELLTTTGPQHTVKLSNGTQVLARHRTKYFYDEGAPGTGGPYHLVTKMIEGALLSGGTESDVHTTTTSYSGQEGLGWKLHAPTSITTDPSGLKIVRTKLYDAATGYVTDAISPAGNQAGGDSHDMQTIYYTALANSKVAACGLHPEWANLPCQQKLAKQPETAGVPNPPVTTQTFNMWDSQLEGTDVVGSSTHKITRGYDAAGRLQSVATASTTGTALPTVTYGRDPATGQITTSSTTEGTTTRTTTSVYDKWDEATSYTDADGVTAKYAYDVDGRTTKTEDGKGSQTYTYDPVTGERTTLLDTAAGTLKTTYDLEGKPLTEVYPNEMTEKFAYDATGQPTNLEYVKTSNCSSNCTWFSDAVVPSITGQWLSRTGTLASQNYKYDNAGRLTQVQDTPAAGGCTTRLYGYDADGNRTTQTTRNPGTGGVCATEGGTTVSHSYDAADRLIDSGATYDNLGDTTSLPAADAGGNALSSTFYSNGALASQTQNGQTNGYHIDPLGRDREVVATGHTTGTSTIHYADEGDVPSWTAEGSTGWTRNIEDMSGNLVATQTNGEAPVLQITDLHDDVVATASMSVTATALVSTNDTTEFGVPRTSTPPKYSWLGGTGAPTTLPSGVVALGTRSYVPQIGRFLQSDPVEGGSSNAYAYSSGDPVNNSDPSGESAAGLSGWLTEMNSGIGQGVVVREAQREAAARAEAEAAAAAAAAAADAAPGEYEAGPEYVDPTKSWYLDYAETLKLAGALKGNEDGASAILSHFLGTAGVIIAAMANHDLEIIAVNLEICAAVILYNDPKRSRCRFDLHTLGVKWKGKVHDLKIPTGTDSVPCIYYKKKEAQFHRGLNCYE